MLTRLKVKNYQSIKDATIDLEPLTVIVGKNMAGKSALLKALTSLLTNRKGDRFITYGKSSCEVEVTTSEGASIRWTKPRGSGADYLITYADGTTQVFTKLAGAVPEEVQRVLGIIEVEVDNTLSLWPQIHRQGQYGFLVDLSAGGAARAIARMTRLDVVVKAQQLAKSALRTYTTELQRIQSINQTYKDKLEEYTDLPVLKETLHEATRGMKKLLPLIEDYQYGIALFNKYFDAEVNADFEIPDSADIHRIRQALKVMQEARSLLTVVESQIAVDIPVIDDLKNNLRDLIAMHGSCLMHQLAQNELLDVGYEDRIYSRQQEETQDALAQYSGSICPVCGGIID